MASDQSPERHLLRFLEGKRGKLVLLAVIGVGLVAIVSGALVAAGEGQQQVEYTAEYDCFDHETMGGEYRQDCYAQVNVKDLGDASFVEVRAVDWLQYETKRWTVPHADEKLVGHVWASEDATGELRYDDFVIITATYPNGDVVEVERHQFDCEDVSYKDACGDQQGVQA